MLKRVRTRSTPAGFLRRRAPYSASIPSSSGGSAETVAAERQRTRLTGLWRHADFLRFWAADAISETGSQITLLALPLLAAIALKASPAQMGFLMAAGTLPNLIFGLISGVWVDRIRRRRLMIAIDFGQTVMLLTIPIAWALGDLRIELLYIVTFLTGTLKVFFDVAYMSYLPELIGRENLLEGNGKLQATASTAQVVGPGLAGVLVGAFGAANAVLLDALSFLGSALFLGRIQAPEREPESTAERSSALLSIRQGFRLALGNATLRALTLSNAAISLFGYIFMAVYILYMVNVLGLSASEVGLIFGLGGVGALIGSTLAGPIARRIGVGQTVIAGRVMFALCGAPVPLAVLVPSIALPMVVMAEFLQWLSLLICTVNAMSVRQAITPDRYLGRINATSKFLAGGMIPIGSLLGGALGEVIGVKATLVVGIVGFFFAAILVYFSPLRQLTEQPEPLEIDDLVVVNGAD